MREKFVKKKIIKWLYKCNLSKEITKLTVYQQWMYEYYYT